MMMPVARAPLSERRGQVNQAVTSSSLAKPGAAAQGKLELKASPMQPLQQSAACTSKPQAPGVGGSCNNAATDASATISPSQRQLVIEVRLPEPTPLPPVSSMSPHEIIRELMAVASQRDAETVAAVAMFEAPESGGAGNPGLASPAAMHAVSGTRSLGLENHHNLFRSSARGGPASRVGGSSIVTASSSAAATAVIAGVDSTSSGGGSTARQLFGGSEGGKRPLLQQQGVTGAAAALVSTATAYAHLLTHGAAAGGKAAGAGATAAVASSTAVPSSSAGIVGSFVVEETLWRHGRWGGSTTKGGAGDASLPLRSAGVCVTASSSWQQPGGSGGVGAASPATSAPDLRSSAPDLRLTVRLARGIPASTLAYCIPHQRVLPNILHNGPPAAVSALAAVRRLLATSLLGDVCDQGRGAPGEWGGNSSSTAAGGEAMVSARSAEADVGGAHAAPSSTTTAAAGALPHGDGLLSLRGFCRVWPHANLTPAQSQVRVQALVGELKEQTGYDVTAPQPPLAPTRLGTSHASLPPGFDPLRGSMAPRVPAGEVLRPQALPNTAASPIGSPRRVLSSAAVKGLQSTSTAPCSSPGGSVIRAAASHGAWPTEQQQQLGAAEEEEEAEGVFRGTITLASKPAPGAGTSQQQQQSHWVTPSKSSSSGGGGPVSRVTPMVLKSASRVSNRPTVTFNFASPAVVRRARAVASATWGRSPTPHQPAVPSQGVVGLGFSLVSHHPLLSPPHPSAASRLPPMSLPPTPGVLDRASSSTGAYGDPNASGGMFVLSPQPPRTASSQQPPPPAQLALARYVDALLDYTRSGCAPASFNQTDHAHVLTLLQQGLVTMQAQRRAEETHMRDATSARPSKHPRGGYWYHDVETGQEISFHDYEGRYLAEVANATAFINAVTAQAWIEEAASREEALTPEMRAVASAAAAAAKAARLSWWDQDLEDGLCAGGLVEVEAGEPGKRGTGTVGGGTVGALLQRAIISWREQQQREAEEEVAAAATAAAVAAAEQQTIVAAAAAAADLSAAERAVAAAAATAAEEEEAAADSCDEAEAIATMLAALPIVLQQQQPAPNDVPAGAAAPFDAPAALSLRAVAEADALGASSLEGGLAGTSATTITTSLVLIPLCDDEQDHTAHELTNTSTSHTTSSGGEEETEDSAGDPAPDDEGITAPGVRDASVDLADVISDAVASLNAAMAACSMQQHSEEGGDEVSLGGGDAHNLGQQRRAPRGGDREGESWASPGEEELEGGAGGSGAPSSALAAALGLDIGGDDAAGSSHGWAAAGGSGPVGSAASGAFPFSGIAVQLITAAGEESGEQGADEEEEENEEGLPALALGGMPVVLEVGGSSDEEADDDGEGAARNGYAPFGQPSPASTRRRRGVSPGPHPVEPVLHTLRDLLLSSPRRQSPHPFHSGGGDADGYAAPGETTAAAASPSRSDSGSSSAALDLVLSIDVLTGEAAVVVPVPAPPSSSAAGGALGVAEQANRPFAPGVRPLSLLLTPGAPQHHDGPCSTSRGIALLSPHPLGGHWIPGEGRLASRLRHIAQDAPTPSVDGGGEEHWQGCEEGGRVDSLRPKGQGLRAPSSSSAAAGRLQLLAAPVELELALKSPAAGSGSVSR